MHFDDNDTRLKTRRVLPFQWKSTSTMNKEKLFINDLHIVSGNDNFQILILVKAEIICGTFEAFLSKIWLLNQKVFLQSFQIWAERTPAHFGLILNIYNKGETFWDTIGSRKLAAISYILLLLKEKAKSV